MEQITISRAQPGPALAAEILRTSRRWNTLRPAMPISHVGAERFGKALIARAEARRQWISDMADAVQVWGELHEGWLPPPSQVADTADKVQAWGEANIGWSPVLNSGLADILVRSFETFESLTAPSVFSEPVSATRKNAWAITEAEIDGDKSAVAQMRDRLAAQLAHNA